MPRTCRALRDHFDEFVGVEPGGDRQVQAFAQPLHHAGDADLVDHLGELTRARIAEPLADFCVTHEHRVGPIEHLLVVGPAHHRELAVLGPGLPARHRSIDEADAAFGARLGQFARERGRGSGVVDDDSTFGDAGKHTVVAVDHRTNIVVGADAHHDDLGVGRGFARGCG